jgi:four helix bundle protein
MASYRELIVWQKSMDLTVAAYALVKHFPKDEAYGLSLQIRRAASSIPANIAEGWGREGSKEFAQFARVAQGSLKELETHLFLSARLKLAPEAQINALFPVVEDVSKLLRALIRSLQSRSNL